MKYNGEGIYSFDEVRGKLCLARNLSSAEQLRRAFRGTVVAVEDFPDSVLYLFGNSGNAKNFVDSRVSPMQSSKSEETEGGIRE